MCAHIYIYIYIYIVEAPEEPRTHTHSKQPCYTQCQGRQWPATPAATTYIIEMQQTAWTHTVTTTWGSYTDMPPRYTLFLLSGLGFVVLIH